MPARRIVGIAVSVAFAFVSEATAKPAGPPVFDECRDAAAAQDHPRMLECFRKAYAIHPAPALLYNMAQLERLLGDCVSASAHYRMFLDTNPSNAEHAKLARGFIDECRDAAAASPVLRVLRAVIGRGRGERVDRR